MVSAVTLPIMQFNIRRPDYDISGIAEGAKALGDKMRRDEAEALNLRIGAKLSGKDLRGGANVALKAGDLKTGMALNTAANADEDRTTRNTNQAEDRRMKARKYVAGMMSTLDPNSETFHQDWTGHIDRLRRSGYNIGPEYDDPVTGFELARSEMGGSAQPAARRQAPRQRTSSAPVAERRQETGTMAAGQGMADAISGDGGSDGMAGGAGARRSDLETHKEIEQQMGKAKRGYIWAYDENGGVTQRLVAKNEKPIDRSNIAAVDAFTSRLDAAEKQILEGGYLQNLAGEKAGIGKAGRAYEDFEMAALGVVYAMSGKQTTNKEMERFLKINKPQWDDSSETIKYRTGRVRGVLNAITQKVKSGVPYDQAEREALAGADTLQSPGDREQSGSNPYSGMSDDELLRELSR